jgi:hypothetical protein
MKTLIVAIGVLFSCIVHAQEVDLAKLQAEMAAAQQYVLTDYQACGYYPVQLFTKCLQEQATARLENGYFKRLVEVGTLRVATVAEYGNWLKAYLKAGGNVLENRGPWTGTDVFYIATKNFKMPASLRGASAIKVIVPAGVTVEMPVELGHSVVYLFSEPYYISATAFVPVYDEIK